MDTVSEEDKGLMACVIEEALRVKAARQGGAVFEFELLGRKALGWVCGGRSAESEGSCG